MSRAVTRPTALLRALLGRNALIAFTLVLNYGTGLYLFLLHEAEGGTEPGAPPPVIHWLRDSSLSLPLVGLGIFLGAAMARQLLDRHGRGASGLVVASSVAMVLAVYASIVLSIGNPVHGYLFQSTHGGHDLPFAVHIVRDGLLALTANEVLAVIVAGAVLGRHWLRASRSPRVAQAAAI